MESIQYGIRSPKGEFDRRPVKSQKGISYDFGQRGKGGKATYMSKSGPGGGGANYVKQSKSQGITGKTHGSGKNSFGSPKGSVSSFKSKSGMAKQTKGFGGQTTKQY